MTKVKTLDDLKRLRMELQDKMNVHEKGMDFRNPIQVKVAMATCGIASGAKSIMEFFVEELDKRNMEAVVVQTGCMGYCYAEPTVEITCPGKDSIVFGFVDMHKADEIIEKYMKNGELIDGIIPVNYETIDKK